MCRHVCTVFYGHKIHTNTFIRDRGALRLAGNTKSEFLRNVYIQDVSEYVHGSIKC